MNPIKFFAWNIDQARREEKHQETKWNTRSRRVKNLINKVDADIFALIEIRDLETSLENAQQFLSTFINYDKVSRRYCHHDLAFTMALMINKTRFFVGDTRIHNFHNTPQNDKMVMFVDLQDKISQKWITIGVTHFALEENLKWDSVYQLETLIKKQKYPTVVYGDYNFFDDREGTEQRLHMLNNFVDIAYPLYMNKDKSDEILSGTFIGFPHDEFKQSFKKMSRLDHIFTSKHIYHSKAYSPYLSEYKCDNTNYNTYNYPSDHLALLVQFTI